MLRFVTFTVKSSIREPCLGLLLADHSVINLSHDGTFPTDMMSLIKHGDKSLFEHARQLIKTSPSSAIISAKEITLLPPIVPTRNILCIGKNYLDHVSEVTFLKTNDKTNTTTIASSSSSSSSSSSGSGSSGSYNAATVPIPAAPIFFTKAPDCAIGHLDYIDSHRTITKYMDYEVELAVVIGKEGKNISEEQAMEHVFGYTAANDVSSRDLQKHHSQWFKGKTLDRSCPLGPCIVPHSELPSSALLAPHGHPDLTLKLWLNEQLKQHSRTSHMIFTIPQMIASLSQGFTLKPGDVLLTGTPKGVGYAAKPPRTLISGDVVKIEIEHIGVLQNDVR